MPQTNTVVLVINETSSGGQAGDLEKNIGNLAGVQSVQAGAPGQGSLAKHVRVGYDPTATNPQALRADLEGLGYAVTAIDEE